MQDLEHHSDNEAYFERLYSTFNKKVLNTAFNMVRNRADAEEITQDVFVEVYFNLQNFNNNAGVSTWIYRITVNKSIDVLKKRNRQKRFAWLTSLFDTESGKELHMLPDIMHPGVIEENKEQMALLFKQIDLLPLNQKTALLLNVMEQLSYQEISEIMQVSISAVESLLFRARKTLKSKINTTL